MLAGADDFASFEIVQLTRPDSDPPHMLLAAELLLAAAATALCRLEPWPVGAGVTQQRTFFFFNVLCQRQSEEMLFVPP